MEAIMLDGKTAAINSKAAENNINDNSPINKIFENKTDENCHRNFDQFSKLNRESAINNNDLKFVIFDDKMENENEEESLTIEGPGSMNGYVSQSEEFYSAKDFSMTSDSTIEIEDPKNEFPNDEKPQRDHRMKEVNEKEKQDNALSDNGLCDQIKVVGDKSQKDTVKNDLFSGENDIPLKRYDKFQNENEIKQKDGKEEPHNSNNLPVEEENHENVSTISDSDILSGRIDQKSQINNKKCEEDVQINHLPSQNSDETNQKCNSDESSVTINRDQASHSVSNKPNIVEMKKKGEPTLKNTPEHEIKNGSNEKEDSIKIDQKKENASNELSAFVAPTIKSVEKLSNINENIDNTPLRKLSSKRKGIKPSKNVTESGPSQQNHIDLISKSDKPQQNTDNITSQNVENAHDKTTETSVDISEDAKDIVEGVKPNNNNFNCLINGAYNYFKDVNNGRYNNDLSENDHKIVDVVTEQDQSRSSTDNQDRDTTKNNKTIGNDHNSVSCYAKDRKDDRKNKDPTELTPNNIFNAFLNQNNLEGCKQEVFNALVEDRRLPEVASVTTSVMDAPCFQKMFHTMNERRNSKIDPDSIEYDSLNSGSYASNGSTESIDKAGTELKRMNQRNSFNNAKIRLPNEIQTCGKCCDDIKNNVLYNDIDSLMKNDDIYKNGNRNHLSCNLKNEKMSKDLFYVQNERVRKSSDSGSKTPDEFRTPRGSEQFDDKPTLTEISTEKRSSLFRKMSTLPLDLPEGSSGGDSNHSRLLDDEASTFIWKRLLAQILAVSAKNTLALNFGMSVGFQTIAIPSLSQPNSDLFLDQEQTSIYGSLFFTVIPLGCLLSGPTIHGWGRKPAMLVFCLPLFVGWWVYYFAKTPAVLYIAILLMGLVNGLLEAPILTYVAEITEARWRGMLASSSIVAALLGVFLQMVLGNFFSWRTIAAINSVFPIISFITICFVPESPHWLAGKGRTEAVEKSLMWLRGWVDKSSVASEVDSLMASHSQPKVAATPLSWKAYASRTFIEPFLIVIGSFAIGHFSGMATVQTYSVSIFDSLGVKGWSWTAAMGASQVLGATVCVIALPLLGKRPIAIISMVGVGVGMTGAATANGPVAASALLLANFGTNACSRVVPWVLIGEVFTNEMRAIASGISSCICYVMAFVLSYTYLRVEAALTLRVLLGIYAAVGFIGAVLYYLFLPETEGKTLDEVQEHFSRKQYKGTDNLAFENEKP